MDRIDDFGRQNRADGTVRTDGTPVKSPHWQGIGAKRQFTTEAQRAQRNALWGQHTEHGRQEGIG
jgi:hypothetical protein